MINSPDQITVAWLSQVLKESVRTIDTACDTPFGALACHLTVSYDQPTDLPTQFFLKMKSPDATESISGRGKGEIQFYQEVGLDHNLPIPRAYVAEWDESTAQFNLLLNDLTVTHYITDRELPPSEANCYRVMDALAALHAHWWGQTNHDFCKVATAEDLAKFRQGDAEVYAEFADFLGDRITPQRRKYFEDVLAARPQLDQRLLDSKSLTVCHGDAHAWNFLYPQVEDGRAILLDWERVLIAPCTHDAAYMIGHWWYPAHRARMEKPLLQHYHAQLLKNGVQNYDWEACWLDYRHSIIQNLFEAAWWWKYELPNFLWWIRLECILNAYEDLNCAELVG